MKYRTFINANFVKSGSGTMTARLNMPVTVLRDMGITESDRTVIWEYNPISKEITLKKYFPLETFDIDFEYKFVEKINDCFDKIIFDYFEQTHITGSKFTFSISIGGRQIGNKTCERDDCLMFDESPVLQILLQKNKISINVNISFFESLNFQPYKKYIEKLKVELQELAIKNKLSIEEGSEIINNI